MKTLAVGELKTHFSEALEDVKSGEEIVVTYGKKKENIAVLIPYSSYRKNHKILLGLLSEKKMKINENFAISENELLNL